MREFDHKRCFRPSPSSQPAMLLFTASLLAAALASARAQLPNKTVTYQLNQSTIIMCVPRAPLGARAARRARAGGRRANGFRFATTQAV